MFTLEFRQEISNRIPELRVHPAQESLGVANGALNSDDVEVTRLITMTKRSVVADVPV